MSRLCALTLAVTSLLGLGLASGCTPASPPESTPSTGPSPDLRPRYQPIPRDICHRLDMGEIAERFDLSVPSWLDPAGSYFDVREHTRFTGILCLFRAVAIDDRFATEAARFEPDGSVDITVYDEPGDARYKYDQHTEWVDRRRERLDAGVAQARGWWDRGEYLEHIEDRGAPEGMGPVSDVEIVYGVYHVNLFIEAVMRANPNSEDVAEATAVMHELLRALLDETVRHLDRAD